MYTGLTADQSAHLLTARINHQLPFLFLRYGDGALECMAGHPGGTRDGEQYSAELAAALLDAWREVIAAPNVYIGDWQSASFDEKSEGARYAKQYAELIGDARPQWLHFETLLLMRESAQLMDFYRAVRRDPRRKLFMGPQECAGAAAMLGAEHLVVPMKDLFRHLQEAPLELHDCEFDVLLYGAGMAGHIPVVECWKKHPERTYINLGSAMDPLFRGVTRSRQIHPPRARVLFRDLLRRRHEAFRVTA